MKALYPLSMSLVLVASCADSHPEGRREPDATVSSHDDRDAAQMLPATEPDAGARDGASEGSVTQLVGAAGVETQVWVGQMWSFRNGLCTLPREEFGSDEGRFDRVVLLLAANENGEIAGRIQFGESNGRPLPDSPDDSAFDTPATTDWVDPDPWFVCSSGAPVEGVEYELVDVVRSDTSVAVQFVPNLFWDRWCATARPVCKPESACAHTCVCADGRCKASTDPQVGLLLTLRDGLLEGRLRPGWNPPPEVRLRRVR